MKKNITLIIVLVLLIAIIIAATIIFKETPEVAFYRKKESLGTTYSDNILLAQIKARCCIVDYDDMFVTVGARDGLVDVIAFHILKDEEYDIYYLELEDYIDQCDLAYWLWTNNQSKGREEWYQLVSEYDLQNGEVKGNRFCFHKF